MSLTSILSDKENLNVISHWITNDKKIKSPFDDLLKIIPIIEK